MSKPGLKMSIKNKLMYSVVVTIFILGLFSSLFVYFLTREFYTEVSKEGLSLIAGSQAEEIYTLTDHSSSLVSKIAVNNVVLDYFLSDYDLQDEVIVELLENYNIGDAFSAIYLLDETGTAISSTVESFVGNNYSFRYYYKNALEGLSIMEVGVGTTSGELGYYFSSAVESEDGDFLGVAVVKLRPEVIAETMASAYSYQGRIEANFMLVDYHGVVVFSQDEEKLFKSLGELSVAIREDIIEDQHYPDVDAIESLDYQFIQDDLNDLDDMFIYEVDDELDGEKEMLVVFPIENGFFLVTQVRESVVEASARTIAATLAIFIFLASFLSALVVVLLVRRLLAPLQKLQFVVEEIDGGDLNKRVNINTGDELQELGEALNRMTSRLVEAKTNVEIKIEQRTEELKKFQMAVENASDHIVITDLEGNILYANKAVEKITGFAPEEIVGKKAGDKGNWGGLMDLEFYEKLWKIIKEDKQVFKGEFNNQRKNGAKYIAEANISPILDENGEVKFFLEIERDITRIKEIEDMRTEFISLASHQFRTPLSGIKWISEILLGGDVGELNDKQKELIGDVQTSNERMINLINALLQVSKIETEKTSVKEDLVDISVLVEEVVAELKGIIGDKKIKIEIEISEEISKLKVDSKLLKEIYLNLLDNAVRYSKENGEVKLLVKEKGSKLISEISDKGYGIPMDEQDRIFDKFYRGTNIVKVDTEGSGLGVYLAEKMLKLLGGEMWFESKENEGSTFWFSLPIKK